MLPYSLPESALTLAAIACRAAGKLGNKFPAALNFAGKPFQRGILDSHSLLEFTAFVQSGTLATQWGRRLPGADTNEVSAAAIETPKHIKGSSLAGRGEREKEEEKD